MQNVSMKAMLEAGVHFGHQTSRWNPKMARFIFGERNGIHILDLQKTVKEVKKAYSFLVEQAKGGSEFLFVGTKKQGKAIIKEEAERADCSCVYEKWLGGTLTNFSTIQKSVQRLEELEGWQEQGLFKAISKKELSRLSKEKERLTKLLSGIRDLKSPPDIMFVIDPTEDKGAILEAKKLNIPIVAVCDTNCDPDGIDVPIPGNDDAARSIKFFCALAADAIIEGRKQAEEEAQAAELKQREVEEEQLSQTENAAEEGSKVEAEVKEEAKEEKTVTENEVEPVAGEVKTVEKESSPVETAKEQKPEEETKSK